MFVKVNMPDVDAEYLFRYARSQGIDVGDPHRPWKTVPADEQRKIVRNATEQLIRNARKDFSRGHRP